MRFSPSSGGGDTSIDDDVEEVLPPTTRPPINDEPELESPGDDEDVAAYDPITGLPLDGAIEEGNDGDRRPPSGVTDEELFEEIEQEMEAEEQAEELGGGGRFRVVKRDGSPLAHLRIGLAGAKGLGRRARTDNEVDAIEMSIAPPGEEAAGDYLTPVVTSDIHRPSSQFGNGGRPAQLNKVATYDGPIMYAVPRTGYYCVGVVPVTLVESSRRAIAPSASHAEYSGSILFRSTFEGELPAAEYPKVGFYLFLSTVYAAVAIGWGLLCFRFVRELLPMQYYISGTMAFLVVEMLANYGYYRYLNKHGGGSGSMAFLFVGKSASGGERANQELMPRSSGDSERRPEFHLLLPTAHCLDGIVGRHTDAWTRYESRQVAHGRALCLWR